jgi:predicted Zn-dependent peptidase
LSQPSITREVLPSGLRLTTETMPHVRSVSVGVWLTRGSRHEPADRAGIAHLVEHMLFKGTRTRTQEQIAQAIDSVGGHMDAFTAKEYAGYFIKVLDEHLPVAVDILSDIVLNPVFAGDELEREQRVVLEEIKMVEDTPDDLVHEIFSEHLWQGHPIARPILGTADSVRAMTPGALREYFDATYHASNLLVVVVGNVSHARVADLVGRTFGSLAAGEAPAADVAPVVVPHVVMRRKELEQSHVCLGTAGHPQDHADRYAGYVLNTVLGGSMSSRLFQNVREKRGLAYTVYSGMAAYRDTGSTVIYAGCANDQVAALIDVVVGELRALTREAPPAEELVRARDHLKGSLMLGLESTSSRMSHLARQEIYFDRHFALDETLAGIDAVTSDDVQRVARDLFAADALSAAVVGAVGALEISRERLALG